MASGIQPNPKPENTSSKEPAVPNKAAISGKRFPAMSLLIAAGFLRAAAYPNALKPNTATAANSAVSPFVSGAVKNALMNSASSQAQRNADPTMILMPAVP
ncbi:hypothetical protein [Paraeggerthella sp.]|uniref:hypothetical protein n=1 Tax=Paraeggerthella sp. TaxID=2897350 RepID=UPI003529602D